jgi:hypothetical protein
VCNLRTGFISSQFHLVFDDEFSTVPFMQSGEIPPLWTELVQKSAELVTDVEFDLATTWANNHIAGLPTAVNEEADGRAGAQNLLNGHPPLPHIESSEEGVSEQSSLLSEEGNAVSEEGDGSSVSEEGPINPLLFPTMPDLNELTCRRSTRIRRRPNFLVACTTALALSTCATTALCQPRVTCASIMSNVVLHTERVNTHFDGTLNYIHHAVLMTDAGDNDTYTLKDMLKQDDRNDFIAAMVKEVCDHESRDHWTLMPRSSVPAGVKTILYMVL